MATENSLHIRPQSWFLRNTYFHFC